MTEPTEEEILRHVAEFGVGFYKVDRRFRDGGDVFYVIDDYFNQFAGPFEKESEAEWVKNKFEADAAIRAYREITDSASQDLKEHKMNHECSQDERELLDYLRGLRLSSVPYADRTSITITIESTCIGGPDCHSFLRSLYKVIQQ